MALISRFGASVGLAAALSMAATPAFAAELPQGIVKQEASGSAMFADFDTSPFDTTTIDADTEISEWRRGWRRGRWRRHRRVDAGDVLAGVLIIGGIAAIASAANKKDNRRRDRDYERRDDRRYDRDRRDNGSRGLDNAVDQCVNRIQRDVRVDSVDSVDRTAQGWVVTGSLFNGTGFTCAIDNNGKIDAIDYGDLGGANLRGVSATGQVEDNQWDDDRYIAARQNVRGAQPYRTAGTRSDQPLVPLTTDRQPAYPGGPLPGDE